MMARAPRRWSFRPAYSARNINKNDERERVARRAAPVGAEQLMQMKCAIAALAAFSLSACTTLEAEREPFQEAPTITAPSPTSFDLEALPPPTRKIDVAIYSFPDMTGQNKPNDNIAEYSRAVTQGGAAFVIDALRRAGGG